jgi:epsilon-lactone hydrolase
MSEAEREKLVHLLRERGRPNPLTVPAMRERMELLGEKFTVPAEAVVERSDVSGRPAEWVSAPGANPNRQVLWLHGGGYVQGSPNTHRNMIWNVARAADARVLLLDYRLAPEHPFPAALEDAFAAYKWLLARGGQPGKITIAGDSAGGGLTVALLTRIRDDGLPLPAGGVCISPWVDLEITGDSIADKAGEDPMLDRSLLEWFAGHYLGPSDPRGPLASPLHADLTGLPPLLIQVGTAEVLLDDARRLAERARRAGIDVTYEEWERMMHVWHLFAPLLSEGGEGCARVGAWVRARAR